MIAKDCINPVNSDEEKEKFLKEYELGNYYNPQFKYENFDYMSTMWK